MIEAKSDSCPTSAVYRRGNWSLEKISDLSKKIGSVLSPTEVASLKDAVPLK